MEERSGQAVEIPRLSSTVAGEPICVARQEGRFAPAFEGRRPRKFPMSWNCLRSRLTPPAEPLRKPLIGRQRRPVGEMLPCLEGCGCSSVG